MYLQSTEREVTIRKKRDGANDGSVQCQNCLQRGHWTYQCKNSSVYNKRPSRSAVVQNPDLASGSYRQDVPPPELPR